MTFSVIVPVHNSAAFLAQCVAALQAQDVAPDQYEIFMVDNNSTDASAAILAKAAGIRVLQESTPGAYAARNRALREARGRLVAFTDSDCLPAPDWLRVIERALDRPGVQVVLGERRPGRDRGLARMLADYEAGKDALVFATDAPQSYYGFTNNMGVRRETLERYGPFVERLRGSDTIFVRRVVEGEGCPAVVFDPGMRVVHAEMRGLGAYYRKLFTYGRSRKRYRHIITTRPLAMAERWAAFRATVRVGGYPWWRAAILCAVLACGMGAWAFGSLAGALAAPTEQ